ncbi:MAG TPA: CDP-alcohol phosphatidyltransferase family protein, partial [Methylomirabilota bacterium]|nr:CDP-alcohol phosphatidyltransferase family protein [Methylomirabilota bacterium]
MLGRYREGVRLWSDPVGRVLFRLRLRPNHLTVSGLAVSLVAAGAFIAGRPRTAGVLLIVAGLFDLFDGSLARASGQVTPFGAFLDSVIDRYSDLVVMLAIVVLFARTPHTRGALVAMAGLVGSVMVSYTKARAESIGVECTVGMMERPERLICLIAGALFDLLEPALWVLALMANITAVQRIIFTRRVMRAAAASASESASAVFRAAVLACALATLPAVAAEAAPTTAARAMTPEMERAWAQAIDAYQGGDAGPLTLELAADAALKGPIGDYLGLLVADALVRRGQLAAARARVAAVTEHYPDSRLAPGALITGAALASAAGDETAAQALLKRALEKYPDAPEVPEALYLLGQTLEARVQAATAAEVYRELMVLAPATGYADGAADRLAALATAGTPTPALSLGQRMDRAERLLRSGVPKTAADEAERVASEARDPGVVLRALKVVADGAARLRRYDAAARAFGLAVARAPAEQKPPLMLQQARMLVRAGQPDKALGLFTSVAAAGSEADASEALYEQARALDDLGRARDAGAIYRKLATRYPNREVAGAALWRLGWLAYLGGDARGAASEWGRLTQSGRGRTYRGAALYWRGRAIEQSAGADAARPSYRAVVAEAPRSYYGVLASQRLGGAMPASAESPAASVRLPADPHDAVADDPGFARVALLRRVGLVEDAWQELEVVVQNSVGDTPRLYGLSSAYAKAERYHMALRIVRRHFGGLAASGDPALPRAFWEILYPFGWRDDLAEAATRAGLDTFLVAAVVREESSYYPRAVSRTGARGLMQLMPGTARPMARASRPALRGGRSARRLAGQSGKSARPSWPDACASSTIRASRSRPTTPVPSAHASGGRRGARATSRRGWSRS